MPPSPAPAPPLTTATSWRSEIFSQEARKIGRFLGFAAPTARTRTSQSKRRAPSLEGGSANPQVSALLALPIFRSSCKKISRGTTRAARSAMKLLAGLLLALIALVPGTARADKVHDLVDIVGARENQLIGYGVVTGLQGTGDDISSPFALQSLRALLRRLGVQVDSRQIRLKNVAAVIVTANIPAFARNGGKLDIVVSSMGNARSLRGGVLIQTPLRGADRRTYAVGQGPLVLGGFSASGGSGSSVQENITTTARIPNGALIEREIKNVFAADGKVTLALRAPNFDTATRIAEGLNKAMGEGTARALDGGSIEVKAPSELKNKPVELISKLGDVEVDPGSVARVVLNERTGTIVAGGDVRLSPVA